MRARACECIEWCRRMGINVWVRVRCVRCGGGVCGENRCSSSDPVRASVFAPIISVRVTRRGEDCDKPPPARPPNRLLLLRERSLTNPQKRSPRRNEWGRAKGGTYGVDVSVEHLLVVRRHPARTAHSRPNGRRRRPCGHRGECTRHSHRSQRVGNATDAAAHRRRRRARRGAHRGHRGPPRAGHRPAHPEHLPALASPFACVWATQSQKPISPNRFHNLVPSGDPQCYASRVSCVRRARNARCCRPRAARRPPLASSSLPWRMGRHLRYCKSVPSP